MNPNLDRSLKLFAKYLMMKKYCLLSENQVNTARVTWGHLGSKVISSYFQLQNKFFKNYIYMNNNINTFKAYMYMHMTTVVPVMRGYPVGVPMLQRDISMINGQMVHKNAVLTFRRVSPEWRDHCSTFTLPIAGIFNIYMYVHIYEIFNINII
jgi:hypothetical protein